MEYWIVERRVYLSFLVDTNCVNARQQNVAMNQLEMWAANRIIELLTAEIAQNEMLAGSNSLRRAKAYKFIFTMSAVTTDQERLILRQIGQILFPAGAKTANECNDVEIVFNAAKYMRTLITNDGGSKSQPGGMLGNRAKLAAFGAKIVTPDEAVSQVRQAIQLRDRSARKMAELMGKPIPKWVGAD